jgi:hypothetical protein
LLENRQISKKVPSKEESHYNTIIYNITIKEFKKSNKKVMATVLVSKTIPYYYSSLYYTSTILLPRLPYYD